MRLVSKKPRKSRHRVPTFTPKPDPISARYQAEVDRSVSRLARRYEAAERGLESARKKRDRIASETSRQRANSANRKALEAARREVAVREAALLELAALMQPANHAAARHRGRKSFNPGPDYAWKATR